MVAALVIRTDLSAGELRALARREKDPRAASRMYAIAHALEGKSRAEAARLSGMERQALHDAVVRLTMRKAWPGSTTGPRAAAGRCWTRRRGPRSSSSCSPAPTSPAMAARSGPFPHSPRRSRISGASGCIQPACRGCCEDWASRSRRPGHAIRRLMPRRRRPSKGGSRGSRSGGPGGPPRQAHRAVVRDAMDRTVGISLRSSS